MILESLHQHWGGFQLILGTQWWFLGVESTCHNACCSSKSLCPPLTENEWGMINFHILCEKSLIFCRHVLRITVLFGERFENVWSKFKYIHCTGILCRLIQKWAICQTGQLPDSADQQEMCLILLYRGGISIIIQSRHVQEWEYVGTSGCCRANHSFVLISLILYFIIL